MIGADFRHPRKTNNQETQGKKQVAVEPYVPLHAHLHLEVTRVVQPTNGSTRGTAFAAPERGNALAETIYAQQNAVYHVDISSVALPPGCIA